MGEPMSIARAAFADFQLGTYLIGSTPHVVGDFFINGNGGGAVIIDANGLVTQATSGNVNQPLSQPTLEGVWQGLWSGADAGFTIVIGYIQQNGTTGEIFDILGSGFMRYNCLSAGSIAELTDGVGTGLDFASNPVGSQNQAAILVTQTETAFSVNGMAALTGAAFLSFDPASMTFNANSFNGIYSETQYLAIYPPVSLTQLAALSVTGVVPPATINGALPTKLIANPINLFPVPHNMGLWR